MHALKDRHILGERLFEEPEIGNSDGARKSLPERLPEPVAHERHRALTRSTGEETPLTRRARQLARTHQEFVSPPRNVAD
jgi:hypothetical protein